jgi:IS1 family transposase
LGGVSKGLPQEQYQACTKQEGQTNRVERFNLTLRQRMGRLTEKLFPFLVFYNSQKAKQDLANIIDH